MPRPNSSSPRVVSLLPSATELLCAVSGPDWQDLLVGRSHECDYPAGLSHIPILTAPRITATDPREIDAQVRAALQSSANSPSPDDHGPSSVPGGSWGGQYLYALFADKLAALAPDIILTQDLCEVCSIDLNTVRQVAAGLPKQPKIVSLNPQTVEDVFDDCLKVAEAIGRPQRGIEVVVDLRGRLYEVSEFVNPYDDGPVMAFLEWTDPLFCAGHWTVQLIERAGCRHPFNPTHIRVRAHGASVGAAAGPQQGERVAGKSVRMPAEVLEAAQPEYLVICPCGMNLEQAKRCTQAIAVNTWWNNLPAVRKGQVAIVDGNQMFNRPGPRLVDAYEWLVGWIQGRPELIPRGFPWELWS